MDLESDNLPRRWNGGGEMERDIDMLCGTQAGASQLGGTGTGSSQMGNTQINGNGILAEDDGSDTDVKPTDTNAEGIDGADEINKKVNQANRDKSDFNLDDVDRKEQETLLASFLSSAPHQTPPMTSMLFAQSENEHL